MTQFFLFMYTMTTLFVLQAMRRDQRLARQSSQMVTLVGWGLFSLSSTLALLLGAVALALALGLQMPLGAFDPAAF